jgi:hypothetical protein
LLDDSFSRDDLQHILVDKALSESSGVQPFAGPLRNDNSSRLEDTDEQEAHLRREFKWVGMEAEFDPQTPSMLKLREIQQQFKMGISRHVQTNRAMRRLKGSDNQLHKCVSYLKQEVILGPTMARSAILMSSSPSIHEVCHVCGQRVEAQEEESAEEDSSSCRP